MKKVKIKINGKQVLCDADKTVMEVAKDNGLDIPSLCQHDDFHVKANCRVCVVEMKASAKASPRLVTSCSTKVASGMEIKTDTERVKKSRNLNLELLFSEHIEKCPDCIWRVNCKLLELADKYKIEITRFKDRKGRRKSYKFANAVEIDGTQCIDCRNCVDACKMQGINYLKISGKGMDQEIIPADSEKTIFKKHKKDCIYCGQCTVHCPVGAAQEQSHWEMVEEALASKTRKGKIVVAQFAPSIRVSLGEEFGLPYGKAMAGQIVNGLYKLGFDYVFDVNFSSDITTIIEAEELVERVKTGGVMPMFTSCCPAWIKYVEYYRPDLMPNITTSRSPQIHNAGLIKTYWADRMKINPKNIIVVSIMPCTAKKFEASRPELKIKGNLPIDYVLTTRELAWMIKKNKIDFAKLKPQNAVSPLGDHTGAATIYGASGGVMESALRTAQYLIHEAQALACKGKKKPTLCRSRLEFKDVRGLSGVKEAVVDMAGLKVRVAVVNGIGNVDKVLGHLKDYDYIEVMSCPGGCIGGGGQPIPITPKIRQKRLEALYKLDRESKIRKAHENKEAVATLEWLKEKKLEHSVLHTKYKKRI